MEYQKTLKILSKDCFIFMSIRFDYTNFLIIYIILLSDLIEFILSEEPIDEKNYQ